MKITFTGIPSGDFECFCWDVDRETFTRVAGREPDDLDRSRLRKGLYRLYPNDVIQLDTIDDGEREYTFTIEVE